MIALMSDKQFKLYLDAVKRRICAYACDYTPPSAQDAHTLRGSLWITEEERAALAEKTPSVAKESELGGYVDATVDSVRGCFAHDR
jgi:hypothetical protein